MYKEIDKENIIEEAHNNITVIDCSSAESVTVIAAAVAASGMSIDRYLLHTAAIES
jgi:hypothetical protein